MTPNPCPSCGAPLSGSPPRCPACDAPLRARRTAERPALSTGQLGPLLQELDALPEHDARITLGFDPNNDVVIPRPNISGHHALLVRAKRAFYLQDLDSTNGTFVNGRRVKCVRVAPGDIIALGSYEFALDAAMQARLGERAPTAATMALPAVSAQALKARVVLIGRDAECDIILDAPQISRKHVRLTQLAQGWLVEDLGSANGTYLYDPHTQPITRAEVSEEDVIYMGSYRFPIRRLREFLGQVDDPASRAKLSVPLDRKIVTLGRGDDNDVVLDDPQVSRHHARIRREGDAYFVEDLASANGTYINGKRVGRAQIGPQDLISFGTYAVRLDLERGAIQRSYQGDMLLQAEHIRVDVREGDQVKRLLDGISFTAYPSEFVGIMGPSGAGKTTLLMAIIGTLRPSHGRTTLNGDDLIEQYDRYRSVIGYVPQEDIIHGELTVYEALYYTARLRLPSDTTRAEIDRRIDEVLAALEIERTRHVRIGSPERKGISGGQRKRVNLAMELLTEPSLLCLDEPTSGLASEDALNVLRLLRKLGDQGRTILLTIHQPSQQAYRMMDNVLYLADGEQVYYGPTYPDSILYFHPEVKAGTVEAEALLADPGSCLRPLVEAKRAGEPMETFAARYRLSEYHQRYVEERRTNRDAVQLTTSSGLRTAPKFRWRQLWTLSQRYLTIKLKDRMGTAILLIQAPLIALLINLVFSPQPPSALNRMESMPFAIFLLVISSIWFGCSNAAREIVGEQAIYRRERMVNLSIPAYVGSKFLVLGALSLVQCLLLLGLTYLPLDLVGQPLYHLLTLWLCALAATGMGLILSALVRTNAAALALVPLMLIPQVILGGAIMPVHKMKHASWALSHAAMSRWGFEGMLHVEHLADAYELSADELPRPLGPGLPAMPAPPNPIDRFVGAEDERWLALDLLVLFAFMAALVASTGGVLRVRERVER